ncbi:MAG: polysaccharide deacetylase family protein, partial [Actinomycetes bacterium]
VADGGAGPGSRRLLDARRRPGCAPYDGGAQRDAVERPGQPVGDDQPAMARRVLDGGHELGNHTQHHLPMRGLGPAAAHREIVECAHRLRQLTGSQGRWFRASGTQHTTRVIRTAAAHAGYARCLSYDVDSLDWTDPGPDAVVRAVLDNARGGSIISLHLGHRGTIAALPPLIDGLGKKGLRAQSVTELVG